MVIVICGNSKHVKDMKTTYSSYPAIFRMKRDRLGLVLCVFMSVSDHLKDTPFYPRDSGFTVLKLLYFFAKLTLNMYKRRIMESGKHFLSFYANFYWSKVNHSFRYLSEQRVYMLNLWNLCTLLIYALLTIRYKRYSQASINEKCTSYFKRHEEDAKAWPNTR